jgi:hypothetical protein
MPVETREVRDFDRVVIKDYGDLVITQGSQETLTIEADEEVLSKIKAKVVERTLTIGIAGRWLEKMADAVRAGAAGRWVKFRLTVRELRGLEVTGALSAKARDIQSDHLSLRLRGAGAITITGLAADTLEVELPGAGAIVVSGKVAEQNVAVEGAGSYSAARLESQRAVVDLNGAGAANVWVVEDLKATVRGVGSISYYGDPAVTQKIHGLGSISSKGKR